MALIRWIIGFLIAAAAAVFAISNRHQVKIFWNPIDPPFELPLYLIGLGFMGFGFILGTLMVWLNGASGRRARQHQRRQIKNLEKELKAINQNAQEAQPPSDFFPSLPERTKSSK